jgi:hypothetical protein
LFGFLTTKANAIVAPNRTTLGPAALRAGIVIAITAEAYEAIEGTLRSEPWPASHSPTRTANA